MFKLTIYLCLPPQKFLSKYESPMIITFTNNQQKFDTHSNSVLYTYQMTGFNTIFYSYLPFLHCNVDNSTVKLTFELTFNICNSIFE